MKTDQVTSLRRRTILGGALLWVLFFGLSVAALALDGMSGLHLGAVSLAVLAGLALFSVLSGNDISVAGYRLDPFQRAGLGYVLLALAVALVYVPRVGVEPGAIVPLVWVLVLVGLGYQEWTGPTSPVEPSMRQVGLALVLTMSSMVVVPLVLSFLG